MPAAVSYQTCLTLRKFFHFLQEQRRRSILFREHFVHGDTSDFKGKYIQLPSSEKKTTLKPPLPFDPSSPCNLVFPDLTNHWLIPKMYTPRLQVGVRRSQVYLSIYNLKCPLAMREILK